jgi:hypothetical protein
MKMILLLFVVVLFSDDSMKFEGLEPGEIPSEMTGVSEEEKKKKVQRKLGMGQYLSSQFIRQY